jgi:uncharacterized membrane protein
LTCRHGLISIVNDSMPLINRRGEMSMSEAVIARAGDASAAAQKVLQGSGVLWFIPACIGQWIFAAYIAAQYIGPAFANDFSGWNDIMVNGLIQGDLIGNIALGIHLFIAFAITVGGTLQLMPAIRNRAPAFHRWNGRVYIVTALVTSVVALYMTWTRDQIGGTPALAAISIDALLIIAFSLLALRAARGRRFNEHQRWATRTFLVVSGVWFMRVMYGFLGLLAGGAPPGVTDNLDGPTDVAVSFGCWLLPLAVYEIYVRAKESRDAGFKLSAAALVLVAAIVTSLGVFAAAMGMWLPRMS